MINTGSVEQATFGFQMFSEDQIEEILHATFDVMRTVGYKVLHPGARQMLKQAGAIVNEETVKVPEHIVRQCLLTAPRSWTIFDRNGRRAMEVTGRKSYYGTSTAAPNTIDARTGDYRLTQLSDIADGARIADALDHIDFVMPFGSSQDVPAEACDLHEFPAMVANTTKPIVFIGYSGRGVERVYEMAAAVVGGLERLQERPFVMAYPEPIAPMVYPAEVIDRLFAAADLGMPQIPGASVMLGATGPMTVAGATVQAMAESLMCLTLAQLRQPGCPVALSTNMGIMDMASGLSIYGEPTKSTALCAHAQVAQYLGLPTWGLAGATDSKMLDAQAGMEATFHIMVQALAGVNLIHDVGYTDSAMCCSARQLVFGNQVVGMVKHFMRGITVNRDTLAREVIEAVGPGGEYLTQKHTLDHFRSQLWQSKLMDRQPRKKWEAAGAKTLETAVQEEIDRILIDHQPWALDGSIMEELARIRDQGTEEIVSEK
jgi:trimethylamine--corrinoid protein Co-methyltransferase